MRFWCCCWLALPWVMEAVFEGVTIYAKDVQKTASFYKSHFGFVGSLEAVEGLVVLHSPNNGLSITVIKAAKSLKLGQAAVKICFSVRDVEAFKIEAEKQGLHFGSTHYANGYTYANTKDPDHTSVSISSRAFRTT